MEIRENNGGDYYCGLLAGMTVEGSYRIIYHIDPDRINVIAVIHAATNVLKS